jgi:hypothetical protein
MCQSKRPMLFISAFSLLIVKLAFCQPVFRNDTAFRPFLQNLVVKIDSNFHLEKDADFEMRFWTLISKTMERRLFILSQKNGKWTARLFLKTTYFKDTLTEVSIAQVILEKLWEKLNKYDLLTIPGEYELRDRDGEEINDPIHDGISYWFEFTTKKNKRGYRYRCPKSFSEEYKYIKEYGKVVNIITLIYRHCLLKLNIC